MDQLTPDTLLSAPSASLERVADSGPVALHWYDLTCPFCYLGQVRNELLQARGLTVIELPFQAHPEIPPEGVHVGPRRGPMYTEIGRAAAAAKLPLKWPQRLPNSRIALAAAEWVRRRRPRMFAPVQTRLFRAHFAEEQDIGASETVLSDVAEIIGDVESLRAALVSGEPFDWVSESEHLGSRFGIAGTPGWRIAGQMIYGVLAEAEFERLAALAGAPQGRARASS